MGKIKYKKELIEHFKDRMYFTASEAERFLEIKGADKGYVRLMLHKMEKDSNIKRIKRGYYSFKDDVDIIGFLFAPFYYGLQEALSIHKLWGQGTNPVIITIRRVRTGVRSILGRNVVIRRIDRKMFFGYEPKRVNDVFLPISDLEKTVIDFVHFKIPIPEDVLYKIIKQIDREKLYSYLEGKDALKAKVKKILESAR